MQARFTVNHPPKHDGGRWKMNLVRDVRKTLRSKGALFTKEELAEDEVEPTPEQPKRRTLTRLNMQEKADLFMLVKSGTAQLVEACETYKISVATGGRILVEGEQGFYDKLMPPEYHTRKQAAKPVIDVPRESYTDAPALPAAAPLAPAAAPAPEPGPKVNPLDPRLLTLAAEVKLMQERLAELQANAADLGITVVAELKVEWA
ncbi:MAG: hypothetical protein AB7V08_14045 [Elusimicrobiales bacterium]